MSDVAYTYVMADNDAASRVMLRFGTDVGGYAYLVRPTSFLRPAPGALSPVPAGDLHERARSAAGPFDFSSDPLSEGRTAPHAGSWLLASPDGPAGVSAWSLRGLLEEVVVSLPPSLRAARAVLRALPRGLSRGIRLPEDGEPLRSWYLFDFFAPTPSPPAISSGPSPGRRASGESTGSISRTRRATRSSPPPAPTCRASCRPSSPTASSCGSATAPSRSACAGSTWTRGTCEGAAPQNSRVTERKKPARPFSTVPFALFSRPKFQDAGELHREVPREARREPGGDRGEGARARLEPARPPDRHVGPRERAAQLEVEEEEGLVAVLEVDRRVARRHDLVDARGRQDGAGESLEVAPRRAAPEAERGEAVEVRAGSGVHGARRALCRSERPGTPSRGTRRRSPRASCALRSRAPRTAGPTAPTSSAGPRGRRRPPTSPDGEARGGSSRGRRHGRGGARATRRCPSAGRRTGRSGHPRRTRGPPSRA